MDQSLVVEEAWRRIFVEMHGREPSDRVELGCWADRYLPPEWRRLFVQMHGRAPSDGIELMSWAARHLPMDRLIKKLPRRYNG
jgi:hypothetical protein